MNCKFVVLALGLIATGAQAQQMYRCGNSFSQQPCGPGAQAVAMPGVAQPAPLPPDLPAAPEVVEGAKTACMQALRRDVAFRDPESVKVGSVVRRGLFRPRGQGAPVRVYAMAVNAKNAYGGYTGEREFMCFTDPADERTALAVLPLENVR